MIWDDKIIGIRPEEVSYNEKGLLIKDVQYYCDRPRLEFALCLAEICELRFGVPITEIPAEHEVDETVLIGEGTIIGSIGFGFERDEKRKPVRIPHFGNVVIEPCVEIGANTCIDRAVIGSTYIGEHTKIDNLVHIAHGAQIGKNCLIVAGAVIGGSVEIGDNSYIGMNASIKNKVKIGRGCTIGAGAVVLKDVPDGEIWAGVPAKKIEQK